MNDLNTAKTFKSDAFEPSDEELHNAARERRKQRAGIKRSQGRATTSTIKDVDTDLDLDVGSLGSKPLLPRKFTGTKDDLNDSSDEEMPDLADLFAGRESKKVKEVKNEVEGKKEKKRKSVTSIDVRVAF